MQLIHGDCFEEIGKLKFDLVITDPPYWHTKSHRATNQRDRGYHIESKSKFANSALYRDSSFLMEHYLSLNLLKIRFNVAI